MISIERPDGKPCTSFVSCAPSKHPSLPLVSDLLLKAPATSAQNRTHGATNGTVKALSLLQRPTNRTATVAQGIACVSLPTGEYFAVTDKAPAGAPNTSITSSRPSQSYECRPQNRLSATESRPTLFSTIPF